MDRIEKKLDDFSDDLNKSKWLFRGIKIMKKKEDGF